MNVYIFFVEFLYKIDLEVYELDLLLEFTNLSQLYVDWHCIQKLVELQEQKRTRKKYILYCSRPFAYNVKMLYFIYQRPIKSTWSSAGIL